MKSAVCLIVRNEVRDIAEWLAFHAIAGFDVLIVLDNNSDDGTASVVAAAASLYDIRYHPWADTSARSQELAYEAVCRSYRQAFDWIAFVDSDEFVVMTADEPINSLLARLDGWSGVALNWAVYGSNGHDDCPSGLIVENFTRRADVDFFPSRHVKSVVRPDCVERCINAHAFTLRQGRLGGYCTASGQAVAWWPAPERGGELVGVTSGAPDYRVCRVNHYFTRSRAHWRAKLARGYPSNVVVRTVDDFLEHDRNEVGDSAALRLVPAVRRDVGKIETIIQGGKPAVPF